MVNVPDIVQNNAVQHAAIVRLIKDINDNKLLRYYLKEIPGYPFPILHEFNKNIDNNREIDTLEDEYFKLMIRQLKDLIIDLILKSNASTSNIFNILSSHGIYSDTVIDHDFNVQNRIIGPIDMSWVIHCNTSHQQTYTETIKYVHFPVESFLIITSSSVSFRLTFNYIMKLLKGIFV